MKRGKGSDANPAKDPAPSRLERQSIKLRLFDVVIIALALAAFSASALVIYGGPAPSSLVISTDGEDWIYPLNEDRVVQVQGKLGLVTIAIEGGRARFLDSPCQNKLCIGAAPIGVTGDWSACLPSGVFIRVEGDVDEHDEFDAIVR
jgi:hypothetical protein